MEHSEPTTTGLNPAELTSAEAWASYAQTNPLQYDWLVSLVIAFRDKRYGSIELISRRQKFLVESAEFATDAGMLLKDVNTADIQSTIWTYELTDLGKSILLSPVAPSEFLDKREPETAEKPS